MKKVLIVEDDAAIAELERDYLEDNDFAVDLAADGMTGLTSALNNSYDLILLDIMLPKMDGFQVCREIRKHKEIPILMVSAKREDVDKIRGLGLGADDYVIKPFSPSELVARVKAHISRYERLSGKTAKEELLVGLLRIELPTHRVFLSDKEITLTNKEFEVLAFLAENVGIVFSKESIFERVWGLEAAGQQDPSPEHHGCHLLFCRSRYPPMPHRLQQGFPPYSFGVHSLAFHPLSGRPL